MGMKYLGLVRPEHQLELFLAGMARDVGVLDGVVVDVGAGLEEVVDRPRHVLLVAGDRAGADDDGIAWLDLDEAMVAVGHSGQAGHRLALGAGRGDHDLVGGRGADLILAHDLARSVRQVAEIGGDAEVLLHRAPDDGHLAVERRGGVDDLLDAGDVAGESGDDDPAVQRLHDLAEGLADGPLGQRVAGVLGASRVGEQADDAVLAQAGKHGEVGPPAVDRRVVELEVARRDDRPDRCMERDPHRVRDRVADPERLHAERPDLEVVARIQGQERVVVELVLLDLDAQQAARQGRGIDRHAREVRQHVRQAADVILVGVGDQEGPDLLPVLAQVGHVRDDEVDPEHLLVGEHEPAVDDDDVVAVLEDVHVLADLPDASEGDDAERYLRIRHRCSRDGRYRFCPS